MTVFGDPLQEAKGSAAAGRARAAILLVVAALAALAALFAPHGGAARVLMVLVASALALSALWLRIGPRGLTLPGRDAALCALIEEDPEPVLLAEAGGRVRQMGRAARRIFGDAGPATLSGLLGTHLANPGPVLAAIEGRARTTGAAVEDLVTRDGHMRLGAHRAGAGRYIWRLEMAGARPSQGGEEHAIPMLTLGRDNAVLGMNPAARDLLGERITSLDAICPRPPETGMACDIPTPGGPLRCICLARAGRAGQREIFLVPVSGDPLAAPDDWALFDILPVPLLKLGADGTVLRANPPARALIGIGTEGGGPLRLAEVLEGLGRPVTDWVADAAAGRGTLKPEFLRVRRADTEAFIQVALRRARDADAVVLIAVLSDATELKSLQAQFVQSQKMQAIGQLAGGIAHDFNNLLTAISGHCDLLLLHRDAGDPEYADLMQITQNVNRAAALVGQLLAFSRKQTLRPELLDLRDTLADLTHLLNRLVGEQITLTLDHEPGLAAIRADKRQIEQVVMNLVVNARDAMPEGGEIRIVTRNRTITRALHRDRATVAPGRYVSVEVIDTGHGIARDKLEHVFEPFFTTKKVGEGTGLGLSTAYGIVKQTGGFIFVDSVVDEGTTFQLLFPAHDHAAQEVAAPDQPPAPGSAGDGVVLLVEDEVPVRTFASRALRLRGFHVIAAGSAEEALEILDAPGCHVDVFVTDVVMPGMDGPSWVQKALEKRPEARVVFMSGYAEEAVGDNQSRIANSVFLPKPFSMNELVDTVARMLARSPSGREAGPP